MGGNGRPVIGSRRVDEEEDVVVVEVRSSSHGVTDFGYRFNNHLKKDGTPI